MQSLRSIVLVIMSIATLITMSSNLRAQSSTTRATASGPNIVLIVSDDIGWNAVGYHGGFGSTPHIDRIARKGVELDRFYVCPMCSPTRAGLMTGRYPMRFGMARTVVHPWSQWGLPPEELTIAEALATAGYRNRAIFGKWHLGHMDGRWLPLSAGFTEFTGCYAGEIDYFTHQRIGEVDWHHNFENSDATGYVTDLIADDSSHFISTHAKDGPFFCYVAFTAPHTPLEAPPDYLKRYSHDENPSPRQIISAMLACLDDGIGRILDSIERAGIWNNTLVFFINDNGGVAAIPGNNDPLRGAKFSVYEGGVRVPAAVWWPGHIEGGRKIQTPLMNIDVMPTLLKICGAGAQKPAGPFDGLDVSDLLFGAKQYGIPPRDLYHFCGEDGLDHEQIAITSADGWKLIVTGPDIRREGGWQSPGHRVELYRLSEDPSEQRDLAKAEPARVQELAAKLVTFRRSEPQPPLIPPTDRKPADFRPPPHWKIPLP